MADQRATDIHDGELKPVEQLKADPESLLADAVEAPVDNSAPELQIIHMGGRAEAEGDVVPPAEGTLPEAGQAPVTADGPAVPPRETSEADDPTPYVQTQPAADTTEGDAEFIALATDGDGSSSDPAPLGSSAARAPAAATDAPAATAAAPAAASPAEIVTPPTTPDLEQLTAETDTPVATAPPNTAPTDIVMTGGVVAENAAPGTVVASLSAVDADVGDTFTFSLVGGDTSLFEIQGDQIVVKSGASLDFETDQSHSLTVEVQDSAGNVYSEQVAIGVTDVVETITGTNAGETLTGGIGDDVLEGHGGNDTLYGGDGNDTLVGGTGADYLSGGAGDDTMQFGSDAAWSSRYAAYNDTTRARANLGGSDRNYDVFDGGDGVDTIVGTAGNDALFLGDTGGAYPGARMGRIQDVEIIDLGNGNDILDMVHPTYRYDDDLTVRGGAGNDTLWTDRGNDIVEGGDGNDAIHSGEGNDTLYGGAGNDRLEGGLGNDTFYAGAGDDVMYGGANDDLFIFDDHSALGANWLDAGTGDDTLQITAKTKGWTVALDNGDSFSSTDAYDPALATDDGGVVTFDDGATITFDGVENFIW